VIEVLHHCSVAEGMTLFIPVAVLSVAPLQYSVGVASFIPFPKRADMGDGAETARKSRTGIISVDDCRRLGISGSCHLPTPLNVKSEWQRWRLETLGRRGQYFTDAVGELQRHR
jgi:hypothetical protein